MVLSQSLGYQWCVPTYEGTHNHDLKADKRLIFLHIWRGFLKGCESTLTKNASIVHLSFVFSHFALVAYTGFLIMLVFQSRISNWLFAVNARNSRKSLAVSSDSEPEVEPFITQTKVASVAVLQELSENNLNLQTSKQLTISIFAPRIFRPTCMFTDKEDSGRGITTATDKEIQSRNQARIPRNTKRSTTCLHGVHEFGLTG